MLACIITDRERRTLLVREEHNSPPFSPSLDATRLLWPEPHEASTLLSSWACSAPARHRHSRESLAIASPVEMREFLFTLQLSCGRPTVPPVGRVRAGEMRHKAQMATMPGPCVPRRLRGPPQRRDYALARAECRATMPCWRSGSTVEPSNMPSGSWLVGFPACEWLTPSLELELGKLCRTRRDHLTALAALRLGAELWSSCTETSQL